VRRGIVVLGMHRSGTSALTRVINLSGASLPRHVAPPAGGVAGDGNAEAGFWESLPLIELHDEALAAGGSSWHDLFDFPRAWFASDQAATFEQRLVEMLRVEFADDPIFVAKDPRISRLVPLWQGAFGKSSIDPAWVIAVRNPLDVAASLRARDGSPMARGLWLWLLYFLAAERDTRDCPRCFVAYDDLLLDWPAVLERLRRIFGLELAESEANATAISTYLAPSLRHHASSDSELASRDDVSDSLKQVYAWASSAARGDEPEFGPLDAARREVESATAAFRTAPPRWTLTAALAAKQADAQGAP